MKELSVHGVRKSFGDLDVLQGVDLTVPAGSFTAILGSSGSGKTTLLRIVAGFERLDRGVVMLGDEAVDGKHTFVPSEHRHIGYVPQEGALFPHLSVGRNVAFGLPRGPHRRARVLELLDMVGLAGLHRRYPHELSGGQQQRVACARALITRPEAIFADEPTGNLDSRSGAELLSLLRRSVRELGQTVIMVTHDPVAASYAGRVVFLADGRVRGELLDPAAADILDALKEQGC